MAQRKLYRVPQAAEYLGGVVTISMLRNWVLRRKIETVRIGRAVCIPQDALDGLVERGTTPALIQEVRQ